MFSDQVQASYAYTDVLSKKVKLVPGAFSAFKMAGGETTRQGEQCHQKTRLPVSGNNQYFGTLVQGFLRPTRHFERVFLNIPR